MDVGIVIGEVTVLSLPNPIGETPQREQVCLFVQEQTLFERDPLAIVNFLLNSGQNVVGHNDRVVV